MTETLVLSIHPFSASYLALGHEGTGLSREAHTSFSTCPLQFLQVPPQVVPKPDKRCNFPHCVLGPPGRTCVGRILVRYLNHINYLLSKCWSSCCALSPSLSSPYLYGWAQTFYRRLSLVDQLYLPQQTHSTSTPLLMLHQPVCFSLVKIKRYLNSSNCCRNTSL